MATSCDNASWYSFLTFGWINPLVETGVQRQVAPADLAELASAEDTAANARQLSSDLQAQERSGKSHPLLRAVVSTFWSPMLALQVLRIIEWSLGLLNPLLLQRVLVFQEAQNEKGGEALSSEQVKTGILAVSVFILLGLFCLFFGSQLGFYQARVDLRINSALRGTVLARSLAGRTCDASSGTSGGHTDNAKEEPSVYNIISFDVGANIDIIWVILGLWIFPFQFITVMIVLFQQVSWAVVPGLAVILVVKLISAVLLVRDGFLRDIQLRAKDRRMALCEEGFTNVRTLQMLAWTEPFLNNMMTARSAELAASCDRLWMQKMVAASDYSLSAIVTLVTLGFYVIHEGHELKPSVALPVISLVNSLVGPFSAFPGWANRYLIWRSAYDRVNTFLGTDAAAPGDGLAGASAAASATATQGGPVAELKDCSLAWQRPAGAAGRGGGGEPDADAEVGAGGVGGGSAGEEGSPLIAASATEAVVKAVNLQIWPSELLAICGAPSQGKSSLLHGLLGELAVLDGHLHSPFAGGEAVVMLPQNIEEARAQVAKGTAIDGTLPFAAQSAVLFGGTVRSNILFGARHDAGLYTQVVKACSLEADLSSMPLGDGTEIAQGGATLSGGQRARIGLARAAYRAVLYQQEHATRPAPLVLLDDPLCALDRRVAKDVVRALFSPQHGLLRRCALVVTSADPWWLGVLQHRGAGELGVEGGLRVAVLRDGGIVALGGLDAVGAMGLPELDGFAAASSEPGDDSDEDAEDGNAAPPQIPEPIKMANPQDEEMPEENEESPLKPSVVGTKIVEVCTQTTPRQTLKTGQLVECESRQEGSVQWQTYMTYINAVGPVMLTVMCSSLVAIMVFQNFCTLWIAYWTSDNRSQMFLHPFFAPLSTNSHGEETPHNMLMIYAYWVACFTISNFLGHGLEIVGGIRAARVLFAEALAGTMRRQFRWWDANPTGRVLNRFSEDVDVVDKAVTNIIGITFGAVLYFFGHSVVLAMSNPWTLAMIPPVALGMEFYAKYYRSTIRELQRVYLMSVSSVYQDMVEAICGKVTIRAFASSRFSMCSTITALDDLQRVSFVKQSLNMWIGLRMSLIGYTLNTYTKLQPILQYFSLVSPQSAAMVGFSIEYSSSVIGIIQQLIMNYSDLEMQLISIERLREYGAGTKQLEVETISAGFGPNRLSGGLVLAGVEVTYRAGLPPALSGVNLSFAKSEAAAIVGRTGAGKTSLLLAVMQLVPYAGSITVGNMMLSDMPRQHVRANIVSVVPQQPVLFQGNLRFNLDPEGMYTDEELRSALAAVGMRSLCGALTSADSRLKLSQGEQQMVSAARALLRRPQVVLLDEVTACLPAEAAKGTLEALLARFKEAGATVLVVTHQENLLRCCDRIVRISAGRVVSDERIVA